MIRNKKFFPIPEGSRIFVHQAFKCCPYAAMITSKIHDYLEINSYKICEKPEEAIAAVINTCGFNESRAIQAEKAIKLIRKRSPSIPLVVTGCLTVIEAQRVKKALEGCHAWAMIGPREMDVLDGIFEHKVIRFSCVNTNTYKERYSSKDPRLGLYQVLVSMGCVGDCKYCVIRKAKGKITSKPLKDVVEEVNQGIKMGFKDIFLVGDDLSCYGVDIGKDISCLLNDLCKIDGDFLLNCEAFEPSGFITSFDRLVPSFESGKFGWIVLPVQSGSNIILKKMGRKYRREEVEKIIEKLRKVAPDMVISTDFIFGYPSETEEDFELSMDFTRWFDFSNFNEYEQRPGTPPPDVPEEEMEKRRERVKEFLEAQGAQIEVLTKKRVIPFDTWTGKDSSSHHNLLTKQWLEETAEFVRKSFEKKDNKENLFSAGWEINNIIKEKEGISIEVLNSYSKEKMKLLLTPRENSCVCMAFSDKFNLSLVSETEVKSLDKRKCIILDYIRKILNLDWNSS